MTKTRRRRTRGRCRLNWWNVESLGRADNKDNADNVRLIITFPCDNDECQTLEELEAQKNSHLVEFGTEEADSCLP